MLPIKLNKIGRTAIYGSFFNFYLCQFQGNVKVGNALTVPIKYDTSTFSKDARCELG